MKKGRSNYTFQLNLDSNTVNGLIQSYLSANDFKLESKNGENLYKAVDAIMGSKGFSYSFVGQTLNINVWLIGAFGDFPIEQKSHNMFAMNYRNSLNTLFQEISNLNNGENNMSNENQSQQTNFNDNAVPNQNVNNIQQPIQNNFNQFTQTFQAETDKKKEKMCEIGFWISILGLLASFGGVSYGLIVYIMDFYFASMGLKTKKRGKAIATIVLSITSIVITILTVMLN